MPTATQIQRQAERTSILRHSLLVRITHWLTFIAFIALLVTGVEILISHPRFYWGETGNVNTPAAFSFHIPSSRDTVPTGYGYVLPDQNGWSRYLHFEAAWLLVLTGLVYLIYLLATGHLRRNLFPTREQRSLRACATNIGQHLRHPRSAAQDLHTYNVLQRSAYLVVIFILFPLIIWTGLAMSPAVTAAFPATSSLLGGRQTARTLHLFLTFALVFFLIVHVVMVALTGFRARMRGITLGTSQPADQSQISAELTSIKELP